MKFNSTKLLFFSTILIGTVMSLTSNNWFIIWCGLEIMLISFIPLIINKKMISSESAMKYFVIQSISSCMLMMGLMFMLMDFHNNYLYLINSSLFIKMGVAPFHNWVLMVVEGLEFMTMFMLITIMKIIPIMIIGYFSLNVLVLIISLTLIMGSMMGLNQNSMRKMLTYSSIFNMGFILSTINVNFLWELCLLIYSLLVLMVILILKKNNINYNNQLIIGNQSISHKMVIWLNLLSMGGMPPMIGFFIKLMVLELMIMNKEAFLLIVMIIFSLLVMFFYYRVMFLTVMVFMSMPKYKMNTKPNINLMTIFINLLLFPFIFSIKVLT